MQVDSELIFKCSKELKDYLKYFFKLYDDSISSENFAKVLEELKTLTKEHKVCSAASLFLKIISRLLDLSFQFQACKDLASFFKKLSTYLENHHNNTFTYQMQVFIMLAKIGIPNEEN